MKYTFIVIMLILFFSPCWALLSFRVDLLSKFTMLLDQNIPLFYGTTFEYGFKDIPKWSYDITFYRQNNMIKGEKNKDIFGIGVRYHIIGNHYDSLFCGVSFNSVITDWSDLRPEFQLSFKMGTKISLRRFSTELYCELIDELESPYYSWRIGFTFGLTSLSDNEYLSRRELKTQIKSLGDNSEKMQALTNDLVSDTNDLVLELKEEKKDNVQMAEELAYYEIYSLMLYSSNTNIASMNSELEIKIDTLNSEMDELLNRIENSQGLLAELKIRTNQLFVSNDLLLNRLKEVNLEIKNQQLVNQRLSNEINLIKEDLEKETLALSNTNQVLTDYVVQLEDISQDYETLEAAFSVLENEYSLLIGSLSNTNRTISMYVSESEELEVLLQELQLDYSQLEDDYLQLQSEYSELETQSEENVESGEETIND